MLPNVDLQFNNLNYGNSFDFHGSMPIAPHAQCSVDQVLDEARQNFLERFLSRDEWIDLLGHGNGDVPRSLLH